MKTMLLLGVLALSTSAGAADKATCDAKPFTLKGPVAQAPAPAPKSPETKVAEAKPPKAPLPRKPTITIGCKQSAG